METSDYLSQNEGMEMEEQDGEMSWTSQRQTASLLRSQERGLKMTQRNAEGLNVHFSKRSETSSNNKKFRIDLE